MLNFLRKMEFVDWLGVFIVVVIVGLFGFVIPTVIEQDRVHKTACEEHGGKVLHTRGREYCLKAEAFVELP